MSYIERAITEGHAELTGEGKQQKFHCVAVTHMEHYAAVTWNSVSPLDADGFTKLKP